MNTTLIFAELLVIGAEGMIWITLLFISVFGIAPLENFMSYFKDWQGGVYFTALALVYVLGVILDRFADSVFRNQENQVGQDIAGDLPEKIVVIRYSLGTENNYLNQQLEYTRTRMRIARASTINLPLTAFIASFYIYCRLPSIDAYSKYIYVVLSLFAGLFHTTPQTGRGYPSKRLIWLLQKQCMIMKPRRTERKAKKQGRNKSGCRRM